MSSNNDELLQNNVDLENVALHLVMYILYKESNPTFESILKDFKEKYNL